MLREAPQTFRLAHRFLCALLQSFRPVPPINFFKEDNVYDLFQVGGLLDQQAERKEEDMDEGIVQFNL
jgi:hypothetical protein